MNNKNSNKLAVPEAKAAMDRFKMEAASEVGVNLKDGYNGELTARQAGSIGGQMVNNMLPGRLQKTAWSVGRKFTFQRINRRMNAHQMTLIVDANLMFP